MYGLCQEPVSKGDSVVSKTHSDPEMDHEFQDLLEWGLPIANPDAYRRHCLLREGAEDSFDLYPNGVSPFAEDVEIAETASAALLFLRSSKGIDGKRLSQLCWLEECLLMSVGERLRGLPYDIKHVRNRLGMLSNLVNKQQILLAYKINAREKMNLLDIEEEVAGATPEMCTGAAAMRKEVLMRLAPRQVIRDVFDTALKEAEMLKKNRLRRRRLKYLQDIR